MKPKKVFNFVLIGVASLMLIFTLVRILTVDQKTKADPLILPPTSPFTSRIAGIGIVEPEGETIAIGSSVPGIVTRIFIRTQDRVKPGQPLLCLDDREIKAKLQQAQAALITAEIEAKKANAQLSFYRRITDRRAVSEEEMSRIDFTAQSAHAKVSEANAHIKLLETQLDLLTVRAPCHSEVLKISIRVGEYAALSSADQPLMRLGQTQQLMVRVAIDETDIARFDESRPAIAIPRGDSKIKIPLTFVRIEPYVMPKHATNNAATQLIDTRVIDIVYALPKILDHPIYPGQQMDVFINGQ